MGNRADMAESDRFAPAVRLRDIRRDGSGFRVRPDAAERARIAGALGVEAMPALEADFTLRPAGTGAYRLTGHVAADVVQACVVTGAPVAGRIGEQVDIRFVGAADDRQGGAAMPRDSGGVANFSPDDEDEEVLDGDRIDLAAVTMEFLAIGLDPYPRAPGAGAGDRIEDEAVGTGGAGDRSPFAVLRDLDVGQAARRERPGEAGAGPGGGSSGGESTGAPDRTRGGDDERA